MAGKFVIMTAKNGEFTAEAKNEYDAYFYKKASTKGVCSVSK